MAKRPADRTRVLQAAGAVAEAQLPPRRSDRAEWHPPQVVAELGRPTVRRRPPLPQPLLPPTANAGSIQAAGPYRGRLYDTEQLGPAPERGSPEGLRGRAGDGQHDSDKGWGDPRDELLELSEHDHRDVSQHTFGVPVPGCDRARRRL